MCFFFFFQAEDGIRDLTVTGVQTCALPISGEVDAGRCFGFDNHARASSILRAVVPSQFDGMCRLSQAMTAMIVHGKTMAQARVDKRKTGLSSDKKSAAAGRGGAVAGDELRAVLLFLGKGGIGFEAAAAAGFVGAHCADNDELFTFNEPLGVNCGVAAADANR